MRSMNRFERIVIVVVSLGLGSLIAGCQEGSAPPEPGVVADGTAEDYTAMAERLAQEILIVDTHIDVPYRLEEKMEDISVATEGGDFDEPRARAGGLNAPFMSIYIPAEYQETGGAAEVADRLIDMVESFATESPDKFAIATSPQDLEDHFEQGLISLPMGMENGAPVESLEKLRHYFDRGIRYITLTHSKNNLICDSSYEPEDQRQWNGLSPFGREVVTEMNRLGIMVDVSHVSDDTFYQVMDLSVAPAIASHSSVRAFTPGFERNMDDAMIRRLAETGGVIHINFGSSFLLQSVNEASNARWAAIREHAVANGLQRGDEELTRFVEEYSAENPPIFADISDVVAHIDHVVQLVGVDHVGIGSDYDGVGDSLPTGLKDVSSYPNLIRELLVKGYSEEDVRKIFGGNLLRVWREVERVAAEMQAG